MHKLNADQQEHDEVLELLPWHLNDSLSVEESDRVRTHLQQCAACQQEAELLGSALAAANKHAPVMEGAEGLEGLKKVEGDRFDNLMTRIDAAEAADQAAASTLPTSSSSGLWHKLQSLWPFDWHAGAGWSTAVAASVVAVVVSLQFLPGDKSTAPADYEVLSTTPSANDSSLSLRVRFKVSTTTDEAEAVLGAIATLGAKAGQGAKAAQGDSSAAFTLQREDATDYIISVPENVPVEELSALLATLNAEKKIASVEVALPTTQRTDK